MPRHITETFHARACYDSIHCRRWKTRQFNLFSGRIFIYFFSNPLPPDLYLYLDRVTWSIWITYLHLVCNHSFIYLFIYCQQNPFHLNCLPSRTLSDFTWAHMKRSVRLKCLTWTVRRTVFHQRAKYTRDELYAGRFVGKAQKYGAC